MNNNARLTNRIDIVDALRGFSLAGIVIVHFLEQYLGGPSPQSAGAFTQQNPVDPVLEVIFSVLIRGKFFALFSFLFGLSFFIQMERGAHRTGGDFRLRFAWRLVILFVIGFLHHMFYRGDILTVYAMLGLPLILFYQVPDKWVIAVTALLFLGLPRILIQITGYEPFHTFLPDWQSGKDSPAVLAYWEAIKSGAWGEVAGLNATEGFGMKMGFQFGQMSRAYQTFGWFLLGMLAGRWRYFEELDGNKPFTKKIFKWSIIGFFSLVILAAVIFGLFGKYIPPSMQMLVGMTVYDLANITMTFFYITAFVMLFSKEKWQSRLNVFSPYGRTALTNYVMQTLIGTTILYGYGFGLLGEIGNTSTLAISLILCILQIWISRIWLQHYYYGPLEWLWRTLTWFKWQPWRRHQKLSAA